MGLHVSLLHTDSESAAFGIRSISSALKHNGHRTQLLLLGSHEPRYDSRTLESIKEMVMNSDIIGFSCFTRTSAKVQQLADFLRQLNKPLLWGGIYATLNPKDCTNFVDVVCRGEGEGFVVECAEKFEKKQDWKNIANAAFLSDGKYVEIDIRPPIDNLDDLLLLDYDRLNEYHLNGTGLTQTYSKAVDSVEPIYFSGSRGCHFFCNYCSNAKLKEIYNGKGRYVRKMTVEKFVGQAESLKKTFPLAQSFFFADEDFLARSVEEFRLFADIYPKRVGLPFWCMGSPPQMTQEKMELLVKAGLYRIDFGVESGSERTKKEIFNRHISNQVVMKAAQVVSKYPQIIVYYFFIIGNPYEKTEDLLETIDLINKLPPPFFVRTYNLLFFPGTILYEMAIRDGIIEGKKDCGYEIDFLTGLRFEGISWKNRNLYLNGLLFLMAGRSIKYFLWIIPRFLLPMLLLPSVIRFNERHQGVLKMLIKIKRLYLSLRTTLGVPKRILQESDRKSLNAFKATNFARFPIKTKKIAL